MTTIFPEMSGDTVRPRVLADDGGRHGIRLGSPACLSQRRDVIDVDVEPLVRMGSGCWHSNVSLGFAFVKSYAGIAVAALALVAACSSNRPTTTTPPPSNAPPTGPSGSNTNPPPSDLGVTGGGDARAAAQAFLDAGKAQDLQALSTVWGNNQGPLRNQISHDELEKRELIMMCFLKHDTDSIGGPRASAGSRIVFTVTLTQGQVSRATTITTMVGPSSRWYVEKIDLRPIEAMCQKGT